MNNNKILNSKRLTLIASTLEHIRTELDTPERLATLLDASVSCAWPSGEYDRDAMEFFRDRFEEGGKAVEGWYGWYALCGSETAGPKDLVGAGGYFGPPSVENTVEIGYSILPAFQRRGYASEMVGALAENAFTFMNVDKIIAQTTEDNPASISVLIKSGFERVKVKLGADSIRFELSRA